MARALSVRSRTSWLISRDCVPPGRAAQDHANPEFQLFAQIMYQKCCLLCITPPFKCLALWCGSYPGKVQQQARLIYFFCDSHGRCVRVCAMFLHILDSRRKISANGLSLGIPRMPRGTMETQNSSDFPKHQRGTAVHTAAQQQRYNSGRASGSYVL